MTCKDTAIAGLILKLLTKECLTNEEAKHLEAWARESPCNQNFIHECMNEKLFNKKVTIYSDADRGLVLDHLIDQITIAENCLL